ncbi:MAG: peptidyl-prolyl cis-trans isomerase [Acidobacteriota bacterium]
MRGTRRAGGVILAIVAAAIGVTSAHAVIVEEIAAWVNGKIITRSQLLERERAMVSQISARAVGADLDRQLERMRATLLSDMIREEILMQRAEILGLELDKVVKQATEQLKQQQGIKTNAELEALLEKEGISKDELKDTLLRFNVPDVMINLEVRDKIVVTDEEVEDYFASHRGQFQTPETFSIREIVFTKKEHPPEELDSLGAKVMEELEAGTPFNELVVKYSEAPSRFKDGLIGPVHRGDLVREIEEAVLSLDVGQVSGPIPTPAGVHIVKLESHTQAEDPDLDEARGKVIRLIKRQKFKQALTDYFDMLMKSNRIEVNPLYAKYNQGY